LLSAVDDSRRKKQEELFDFIFFTCFFFSLFGRRFVFI